MFFETGFKKVVTRFKSMLRFVLVASCVSSAAAAVVAAPLLNDVAFTTVVCPGTSGGERPVGEDIFGPFEAGFSSQQETTSSRKSGVQRVKATSMAGGIDTGTSDLIVARDCIGTTGALNSGLLDSCGGHTKDYHFQQRLPCCAATDGSDGHAGKVGKALDGRYL
jgi:hypothetical protein